MRRQQSVRFAVFEDTLTTTTPTTATTSRLPSPSSQPLYSPRCVAIKSALKHSSSSSAASGSTDSGFAGSAFADNEGESLCLSLTYATFRSVLCLRVRLAIMRRDFYQAKQYASETLKSPFLLRRVLCIKGISKSPQPKNTPQELSISNTPAPPSRRY